LERIITERRRGEPPAPVRRFPARDLEALFAAVERIFLPRPVARYIARLVAATHPTQAEEGGEAPPVVQQYVRHGASPRAAIALAEASRAEALLAGRPTVGFADVRAVAPAVLNHRLILDYRARLDGIDADAVVAGLVEQIDEAGLALPVEVGVTGA
jgi:MoxR-like ATPase